MLQELAELGMALARAAAQQVLEQGNQPPDATPSPGPPAAGRAAAGPRPDPNLVFERIARAVRQTIALEARIAAGDLGPASHRRPQRMPADPKLTTMRQILHAAAAEAEANRAARRELRREIDERLDDLPDVDLDGTRPAEIIEAICEELGLTVDPATLSDEVLDILTGCGLPLIQAGPHERRHDPPPPLRPSGPDPP